MTLSGMGSLNVMESLHRACALFGVVNPIAMVKITS
jgi:hypothetical protein